MPLVLALPIPDDLNIDRQNLQNEGVRRQLLSKIWLGETKERAPGESAAR